MAGSGTYSFTHEGIEHLVVVTTSVSISPKWQGEKPPIFPSWEGSFLSVSFSEDTPGGGWQTGSLWQLNRTGVGPQVGTHPASCLGFADQGLRPSSGPVQMAEPVMANIP